MNTPNKVLMKSAREDLKGKWVEGVKITAVYMFILIVARFIPKIDWLISLVITGPLMIGMYGFWLEFSRKQNPKSSRMFEEFGTWWRGLLAYVLIIIYTLLWSLLLIVPGIIAAFSYSMTYFILAEDKNIIINDAIDKSKEIMEGNKWKLFRLELRFLGWGILCLLTAGIGFLWLLPYIQLTLAKFYEDVKNKPEALKEKETPAMA